MARRDRQVAELLDQFVCVRLVQGNGLDLSLFQYDFDLTWAVFFLNADRTIYGRYGTRDRRDASVLISLGGLRKSMQAALDLHRNYPANKKQLAGKSPATAKIATPELYPLLKPRFKSTLNLSTVRKSCIHCHMVHEAQRSDLRLARQPIPDEMLWLFPLPSTLGLVLDPRDKTTLLRVPPVTPAAKAGFQAKDELIRLNGQTVISIADVQWVLHPSRDGDTLPGVVRRAGKEVEVSLTLPTGWRRTGSFSWRSSTWDLRRIALGGLQLEDLNAQERAARDLSDDKLGLLVRHVGQFGNHAVAKNAGFLKGDLLVEFAGLSTRHSESELIAHVVQKTKPGDKVDVVVLRKGKRLTLPLPLQ